MDTTDLERVAQIINDLGDKGLLAFIVWLAVDLGKAVICWAGFITVFAVIFSRVRDAVVGAAKAGKEVYSDDSTRA